MTTDNERRAVATSEPFSASAFAAGEGFIGFA